MPVLVETDNILIVRNSLDQIIVNILPIWVSFLFDNNEIIWFKSTILSFSHNNFFDIRFANDKASVYIECDKWAIVLPDYVFEELKLALELAPVDELIPSDFKTIKLIKKEKKEHGFGNLINFQIESLRRRRSKK